MRDVLRIRGQLTSQRHYKIVRARYIILRERVIAEHLIYSIYKTKKSSAAILERKKMPFTLLLEH